MRNNMMPPQGGLRTDGQRVDPVSGNQVPVGSNASEVRDDIPAQLSEGEYVVPADIVRYYGVKFFEDLRNQGKGGLQHMAATGRIGGEPVPAGGPQADQMSPEEMQMMQNIVGAAMGGMMTQPTDPYAQQSTMYQQPKGYATGGFGSREFATSPTRYTGAFSWETPDPAPEDEGEGEGDETTGVTLYCPDGSINVLQLPADQDKYDELLQAGCGLDESILPGGDGEGTEAQQEAGDPNAWTKKYGYPDVVEGEMYPDEETTYTNILDKSSDALSGEGGSYIENLIGKVLGGGALGKVLQGRTHAEVAANIAILNANIDSLNLEQRQKLAALEKELAAYRKANGLELLPPEMINGDQLAISASGMSYMTLLNRDSKDVFGKEIFTPTDMSYSTAGVYQGDFEKGSFEQYATDNNIQFETKAMQQTAGEKETDPINQAEVKKLLEEAKKLPGGEDYVAAIEANEGKTLDEMIAEAQVGDTASSLVTGGPEDKDPVGTTFEAGESPLEKQIAAQDKFTGTVGGGFESIMAGEKTTPTITPTSKIPSVSADSGDKDDEPYIPPYIPTEAKGEQAFGGSLDKETSMITSDMSDEEFWEAAEASVYEAPKDDKPDTSGTTVESVKTTNAVNNTGSDVTIGQVSAGGQDAGDGFVWEKKEGTNALTRKYVGTSNNNNNNNDDNGSNDSDNTGGGGGCCFIMLEARYGNGTMDEVVRRYRDEYMTDRNRRGYYRMAEVLVPLMRKSKTFKWVVTKTFADPLVSYGKYYYGQNKHGVLYSPVKNFWMKVFDIVGGDTKFIRENGEVV